MEYLDSDLQEREVPTFEEYKASLESAAPEFCAFRERYLDDEDALFEMYTAAVDPQAEKVVVDVLPSGADNLQPRTKAVDLTYCISDPLPAGVSKSLLAADIEAVMKAWMQVANLRFKYVPSEDPTCMTSTSVNLRVHDNPTLAPNGGCAAMPDGWTSCAGMTTKSISWYTSGLYNPPKPEIERRGSWSHELTHTLGLVHELNHSTALAMGGPKCVAETVGGIRDVTPLFDKYSVAGNGGALCGGEAPPNGAYLSPTDAIGIRKLYGPPVSWLVAAATL